LQRAGAIYKLVLTTVVCASGCTTPAERIERAAHNAGFEKQILSGSRFDHLIFSGNLDRSEGARLHVYVEGDGSPWIANRWIAEDPTPRNPIALELMRIDPGPALYLGRPCYFGLRRNCTPELWTKGRYSEGVVRAMADALKAALGKVGFSGNIVLIGYSGGGTLAMLLTSHVAAVDTLITVAANQDVNRWTEYHGYSPLTTSLNPAQQAPLPDHIIQIHLLGGSDENVPAELVIPAIDRQPNATLVRYTEYTHECCWTEVWPSTLEKIERR